MLNTLTGKAEAKLSYGDADYLILEQGDYVVCAVTGEHIALAELKYWSADLQEPYRDAQASLERWTSIKDISE